MIVFSVLYLRLGDVIIRIRLGKLNLSLISQTHTNVFNKKVTIIQLTYAYKHAIKRT